MAAAMAATTAHRTRAPRRTSVFRGFLAGTRDASASLIEAMRSPLPLVIGVLLLGASLSRSGSWASAMMISCALLVVATLLRWRRVNGAALTLIAAALSTGVVVSATRPALVPRRREPTRAREVYGVLDRPCVTLGERQRCSVTEPDRTKVALQFTGARCDARAGDFVRATATLTPVQPALNDERLGPGAALVREGFSYRGESAACDVERRVGTPLALVRRAGAWLRATLDRGVTSAFDARSAARARALLFGDDDAIEGDVAQAFRSTGLSHLLAVSGAHVALVAAILGWMTRKLVVRLPFVAERGWVSRVEALLVLPAVTLFVCATGEAPSAVRALVMASLSILAGLTLRRADPMASLAASAWLTTLLVPGWREDIGWQLSIAASWALVSWRREPTKLDDHEYKPTFSRRSVMMVRGLFRWLVLALEGTLRVALITAPIVARASGRVPVTGLVANVVAAPVGEVLSLPLVLATALTGSVSARIAPILAKPASWTLHALFAIPTFAARWPLASVECWPPTDAQQIMWLAIVATALRSKRRALLVLGITLALLSTAVLEVVHRRDAQPTGRLRVTLIDVGQGDAILVDLPDGAAILVDAGGVIVGPDPGERMVLPALALRRRRKLAAVIASHPHPDHVNGLRAVLAWAQVEELWDTRQSERWTGGARWLEERERARARGVRVLGPESLCGPPRFFHGATLEVLAPCRRLDEDDSPNDGSFVLRLEYGRSSVLLPGDLETRGERELLPRLRPVTVLKLGHHGSRTSTHERWLRALAPRWAIVSAGHPSPFSHPHPSVLERLARASIPLRSTSDVGMIVVDLFRDGRWESRDATGVVVGDR
jgi:competence protein ComEC